MKASILKACLLIALPSAAHCAENLVVNGDFETGTGNAFYQTPPWYNCGAGLNQGANARVDTGAVITGTHSATVIDRYNTTDDKPGPIAYVQKTKHTIQEGDSFALSYEWRPSDEYWQRAKDTIRFVLFATGNDKLSGQKVWSSVLTSDFLRSKPGSIQAVAQTSEVVNADAVGRELFIMFYGLDTGDSETGEPHWARVDNIELRAVNEKAAP